MHPDLAAQAADLYRAEREREAQEESLLREARAEPRRASAQEHRRTRPEGAAEQRGGTGTTARTGVRAV